MGGSGPFGEASGRYAPIAVENFQALSMRQRADEVAAGEPPRRVNLLNWDGKGLPAGIFPPRDGQPPETGPPPGPGSKPEGAP
jgi:nitrate reductase beta subunit